jgi:hypothetical protein
LDCFDKKKKMANQMLKTLILVAAMLTACSPETFTSGLLSDVQFHLNMRELNLNTEDINSRFLALAELTQTALPYVFVDGEQYRQSRINANFDAIIEAMKSKQVSTDRALEPARAHKGNDPVKAGKKKPWKPRT